MHRHFQPGIWQPTVGNARTRRDCTRHWDWNPAPAKLRSGCLFEDVVSRRTVPLKLCEEGIQALALKYHPAGASRCTQQDSRGCLWLTWATMQDKNASQDATAEFSSKLTACMQILVNQRLSTRFQKIAGAYEELVRRQSDLAQCPSSRCCQTPSVAPCTTPQAVLTARTALPYVHRSL